MWIGYLAVMIGAGLVTAVGVRALQGKLPRQHWAGIRTSYSLANDEQWEAVHRFGAPYLIFGGVAAFATALALFPFAVAGNLPGGFAVVALVATAMIMGGSAMMSLVLGTRRAKASLGS
ncbi:MAG: SdpI family protein [bacterium]